MSPYDALAGFEIVFYGAAALLTILALTAILAAWVYWSANKLLRGYGRIRSSLDADRWTTLLTPPPDVLPNVAWFVVISALNALLVAAGLFVLGWVIYAV